MAILFQLNIFLFGVIFLNHIHGLASTSKEIDGKYYSFPADKKGQHQASSACSKDGGKLYEPRNKSNYLKVMNEAGFNNIWLGINDVAQEGKFIYQSDNSQVGLNTAPAGTVFFDFTMYAPWCPMHPSMLICPSFGFTGCCVSVDFLNDCWNTIDCSLAAKY